MDAYSAVVIEASQNQMLHPYECAGSLRFQEAPDTGASNRFPFAFVDGAETKAADFLIELVDSGKAMVILHNDGDEGLEGITEFKTHSDWLSFRESGHGWTGEWKVVARSKAREMMLNLATLNRGDTFHSWAKIVES